MSIQEMNATEVLQHCGKCAAENREYVGRVLALGDRIKDAGIAALTGHSSLPGTSSLLAKMASQGMPQVEEITIGLFLGNKNERGRGGVGALLHSLGEEFMGWEDGRGIPLVGWHRSRLFSFPEPVGERELFVSNIADYEQIPRLLGARTVRFFVGFESRMMNRLIQFAGRLRRAGLVPSGPRTASALVRLGGIFALTGYDGGAIQVSVLGKNSAEKQIRRTVTVMADPRRWAPARLRGARSGRRASFSSGNGWIPTAIWPSWNRRGSGFSDSSGTARDRISGSNCGGRGRGSCPETFLQDEAFDFFHSSEVSVIAYEPGCPGADCRSRLNGIGSLQEAFGVEPGGQIGDFQRERNPSQVGVGLQERVEPQDEVIGFSPIWLDEYFQQSKSRGGSPHASGLNGLEDVITQKVVSGVLLNEIDEDARIKEDMTVPS